MADGIFFCRLHFCESAVAAFRQKHFVVSESTFSMTLCGNCSLYFSLKFNAFTAFNKCYHRAETRCAVGLSSQFTEQLVYAMEEAGADLIELGIPFSDPTAEGPVIQRANVRALSGGVTTDKVFDMVVKIRKNSSVPMVFMTYANVVFSYGTERFIKTAAEIGMDGLILPDVPFEEKEEFDIVCKKYGIDLISLIAPTSHERVAQIAKDAEGFVYCVSSLGVTGTRTNITTDIGAMVKLVKAVKDIPCAVGFGISTPEQAKKMAAQSDGAIVGSAIVKLCAEHGADCVPYVKEYVKAMKDAVMEA